MVKLLRYRLFISVIFTGNKYFTENCLFLTGHTTHEKVLYQSSEGISETNKMCFYISKCLLLRMEYASKQWAKDKVGQGDYPRELIGLRKWSCSF
jgi:hypothetical protein